MIKTQLSANIFKLGLVAALVTVLASSTAPAWANSQTVVRQMQAERERQDTSIAVSSQVCPPAGYVYADRESVKDGEFQYCVARAPGDRLLKRSACIKVAPAEEYIRVETGRKDAIYSGMGLHSRDEILFYCLPKKSIKPIVK